MRPVNRVTPKLPADAVKTYQLLAPLSGPNAGWRPATCAEVECKGWAYGWQTFIDETSGQGAQQAQYIRARSERAFVETRDPAGRTVFTFKPGQRCFRSDAHRVPLEREPLYVVRDGDWRGNPRGTPARRHTRPGDWVDDFATHQQALADRFNQG